MFCFHYGFLSSSSFCHCEHDEIRHRRMKSAWQSLIELSHLYHCRDYYENTQSLTVIPASEPESIPPQADSIEVWLS
jgi:hypothetical protein